MNDGEVVAFDIAASLRDIDGSESINSVVLSGVPAGVTLSAGVQTAPGVWTLTVAQLTGLSATVPEGIEGVFTIGVRALSSDNPTDGEFDLTNNNRETVTSFTLSITDNEQPVITSNDPVSIDEGGLVPDGTESVDGTIIVNVGPDGPAEFCVTGTHNLAGITLSLIHI